MKIYNEYDFYQSELHLHPAYKALNGYLNTMNLQAVNAWFIKENVRNDPDKMGSLYEHLMRKSIVGYDKTPYTDEEIKARDLTVLPHFSFKTQIRLLEHAMDCRFDIDYLKVLAFNDGFLAHMVNESDDFIAQNIETQSVCTLVHSLFHQDDFASLDVLKQNCPEGLILCILRLKQNNMVIYIDNEFYKNNVERYHITLNQPVFQIRDELVLSYSSKKMQWLEENHMQFPSVAHVNKLATLLFNAIEQDDFFKSMHGTQIHGIDFNDTHRSVLQQNFNGYKARMLYHKLSGQIEDNPDIPYLDDASDSKINIHRKIKI
jgi:hypothetical protein